MVGDPLRSADRLCERASETCAGARSAHEPQGVVTCRSPRNPGTADPDVDGLDGDRQVLDRVCGRTLDACDRPGVKLCGDPGNGTRGSIGYSSGRGFRPRLCASARRAGLWWGNELTLGKGTRMSSLAEELTHIEEDVVDADARPEELRLLEALLFAAGEPLDEKTLAARLPSGTDVRSALRRLQTEYAPRGVNLVRIGNKWAFRTANDLAWLLTHEAIQPK